MSERIPVRQIGSETPEPAADVSGRGRRDDGNGAVELYASRRHIYIREIRGFFQRIRRVTLWALMLLYFGVCWISIDGQQLVHFDLPARQFHLFGVTFWPQDFVLLSVLLIICAYGLFFITTLFGRVWCGYTCPQTAWTLIFVWIEERIEGSRNQRMRLDQAPMSSGKLIRKSTKHALWLLVGFATGLTFVGYFYPIRELVADLSTLSLDNGWAWFWITFFTLATYLNAGWLREQVCLHMCPYARFQAVMFDQDTLVVSYDPNRGEPRGSRKRDADYRDQGLGDCIDCDMCVQVCPTGIDIRDGLQYECIGCALCIDACDQVMEKMNYAPGLISYTTEHRLEGKTSHILRPKAIAYAVLLVAMMGAFVHTVMTRVPLELDVIKDRGALFKLTGLGRIENSYTLKIMNMSDRAHEFTVAVHGLEGLIITTPTEFRVDSGEVYSLPTSIEVDPTNMARTHYEIEFVVRAKDDLTLEARSDSRFLGSTE